jgi:DNA-binding response OmpR family regulator
VSVFHILLVEDTQDQTALVQHSLAGLDLQMTAVANVMDAKHQIANSKSTFDLFILDLLLPDGDGFEILKELRAKPIYHDTPVFLHSVTDEVPKKITAFSLGADDYLTKAIAPAELRARVEARLRRSQKNLGFFQKGRLQLDVTLMRAFMQGEGDRRTLDLTPTEFKILSLLARHEGQVYNREEIVKTIWGDGVNVLNRTVDSHISGLRRKLGDVSNYIESIAGSGYRFQLPLT